MTRSWNHLRGMGGVKMKNRFAEQFTKNRSNLVMVDLGGGQKVYESAHDTASNDTGLMS